MNSWARAATGVVAAGAATAVYAAGIERRRWTLREATLPVLPPGAVSTIRPDDVLILPWNLKKEIAAQLEYVREWGGQLVVPIPEPEVLQWS